jgi:hypothetical protein
VKKSNKIKRADVKNQGENKAKSRIFHKSRQCRKRRGVGGIMRQGSSFQKGAPESGRPRAHKQREHSLFPAQNM